MSNKYFTTSSSYTNIDTFISRQDNKYEIHRTFNKLIKRKTKKNGKSKLLNIETTKKCEEITYYFTNKKNSENEIFKKTTFISCCIKKETCEPEDIQFDEYDESLEILK